MFWCKYTNVIVLNNIFSHLIVSLFFVKNHYLHILGLNANATEKEIKKAYRKKAMQFHPDRNKSANAEDMFIKINEAYEYLTNPQPKYHFKTPEKSPEEKRKDDFRERMERAQKIYKKREEAERKERLRKFEIFKKSFIYRTSIPIIIFSYLLFGLTLVDSVLPSNVVDAYVKSYQKNSIGYNYTFITTKGVHHTHFDEIITPYYAKKGKRIYLNTTPILNDVKSAYFLNNEVKNLNSVHYFAVLIFFGLLFSIPGLIVRRPGLDSYIAIHLSVIVSIIIVIFIFSKLN